MIDILDKNYEPNLTEMTNYLELRAQKRWKELITFLTTKFNAKSQMFYSRCSAKPGWNIKYKKSSKALCTMYPDKEYFTVLIVFNQQDMEWFNGIKDSCTSYVVDRYENAGMMNGTKWLMIDITDDDILTDVKKMISLKLEK